MEKNEEYFKNRSKELEALYAPFKKFDEQEKEREIANGSYANLHCNELTLEEYQRIKGNELDYDTDHKWWLKNMSIFNGDKLYNSLSDDLQKEYMRGYRFWYNDKYHDSYNLKQDIIELAREQVQAEIRQFNSEYYDWHWEKYGWNAY